jgi:predicted ATP-grasp superfamily ATP-dependent carboligase
VQEYGADFVIPVTDASILALLPSRSRLADCAILGPEHDSFLGISDKDAVLRLASRIGLAVPRQTRLSTPSEPMDSGSFGWPVFLKPSRSVTGAPGRRTKLSVQIMHGPDRLRAALGALPTEAYPVLVQEQISGPGVGIFALRWDGELLAAFSHRRIREKPPWGGVSVYRESIALDSGLLDQAWRLLEAFDWQGVAMVEFKVHEESGVAYLMEVNGRFWGSLQLAIDSGVDFPTLLVAAARGASGEPVTSYRTGVRSRWLLGDLDHLIARFRRSSSAGTTDVSLPSRWRTLADVMVPWRPGDRTEVLRRSDPRPFLRETSEWLRAIRTRGRAP